MLLAPRATDRAAQRDSVYVVRTSQSYENSTRSSVGQSSATPAGATMPSGVGSQAPIGGPTNTRGRGARRPLIQSVRSVVALTPAGSGAE